MKKLGLLKLSLLTVALFGGSAAFAQPSFNSDILGVRFIVNAPSSISGVKPFTYANGPGSTTPWGGSISSPINNAEVVKAVDSEACTSISSAVSGKWALIYRGNCEFGVKAFNAQAAGAAGVIIWNHTPYELVNMAAGTQGGNVTIPVVFVTNADGMAMNNALNNGDHVFISITPWGFGKTHDLAIVPKSATPAHGNAVPLNQFDGSDVPAYRGFTGALVANTGSSTETNVKVVSNVTYTPAGGSPSAFYKDSATLASFPIADSTHELFSSADFKFTPTQIGKYDFSYTLSADDADEYPADNSSSVSFQVTPNVFSRGRFDVSKQQPIVTGHSRVGGSQDMTWGPMFFNHKGGFHLSHLTFSIADADTSRHSLVGLHGDFMDTYVFKWVDGNSDGYMEGGELTLKGIAIKTYTTDDSAKRLMTSYIGNAVDGKPAHILSEDNSYYWVAFNLQSDLSLSIDGDANFFSRAVAGKTYATNKTSDFWAPAIFALKDNINSGDTIRLIPYGVTTPNSNDITQAAFEQQEAIPAVALFTGVFTDKTPDLAKADNSLSVYPNPATNQITAKIDLEKQTDKVYVKVIDAFGRQAYLQKFENVKSKEITISTSNFASGNYYVVVITGEKAISRPFTVIAK